MNVVVIGLGVQGNKRCRIAGTDVLATVDPISEKADYRSLQEVDLSSYEAAMLCTPDEPKLELLDYLIEHGKHVLVEKPLVIDDGARLRDIERKARERGVVCYTAYNHRFEPHFLRLKETLESGELGKPYLLRAFYGNGTARDVRNSPWRDDGMGILADIGSHLLDLALFLFGPDRDYSFKPFGLHAFENNAADHVLFGSTSGEPTIEFETTLLMWRNTFRLDLICEKGSAHIDCLCKWGPSTFIKRTRVLPSGRPAEESETLECADPTWDAEYQHFKRLTQGGETNLQNDIWIADQLESIFTQVTQS